MIRRGVRKCKKDRQESVVDLLRNVGVSNPEDVYNRIEKCSISDTEKQSLRIK